jgi:hypothetical protein
MNPDPPGLPAHPRKNAPSIDVFAMRLFVELPQAVRRG